MTAGTIEKDITLSEATLYSLFDLLNTEFFSDEVPLSRIKWSDRIGTGKTYHRFADFTVFEDKQFLPVIRLSRHLLGSETVKRISEVLFHEMIHIWLWSMRRPWGHTPEFQDKARCFNFEKLNV